MTEEELYRLYGEARVELARYPGVVGVGLGLKERGGVLTSEAAFRVYVMAKKDESELAPEERIPPTHGGVPTDVLLARAAKPLYAHEDRIAHDQLVGGIAICTGRRGDRGFAVGTLGFFATINGVDGPDNVVLVTNRHVLAANDGQVGDKVYQPDQSKDLPNHAIGKTLPMPDIDNHPYQYPPELRRTPTEPQGQFWIDCAAAKLDICISSLCHTNCGVSARNEIIGLGLGGNGLVGLARASIGETVYKVGRRTSRTQGVVSDVALTIPSSDPATPSPQGVLEVQFVRADEPDVTKFADEGDSGAAVVNAQGRLVGIHYSAAADPHTFNEDPRHSLACHIHPVLDALKVTPITGEHPVTDNPAFTMSADLALVVDGRRNETPMLRERLHLADGGRMEALIEAHRREVVQLVNHERRVTIAWHRGQGPAFLNRAIANARDPQVPIPREIGGVARETLLASMARVLAENGSPALRAAIERHRAEVLAYADRFDSLHEMVDHLAGARST